MDWKDPLRDVVRSWIVYKERFHESILIRLNRAPKMFWTCSKTTVGKKNFNKLYLRRIYQKPILALDWKTLWSLCAFWYRLYCWSSILICVLFFLGGGIEDEDYFSSLLLLQVSIFFYLENMKIVAWFGLQTAPKYVTVSSIRNIWQ